MHLWHGLSHPEINVEVAQLNLNQIPLSVFLTVRGTEIIFVQL